MYRELVIEATTRHQTHLLVRHAYDAISKATQLNKRRKGIVAYGPMTWLHNALQTRINKIDVLTRIIPTTRNLTGTLYLLKVI
jgi:hypothetical protein